MACEDCRFDDVPVVATCCVDDEVLEWFPSESLETVATELEFLNNGHWERSLVEGHGRTFVARPVGKAERLESPGAQAALRKEWDRLRAIKCWDESRVREAYDVEAEARQKGTGVHIARIFAIRHEKKAELPEGHPNLCSKVIRCATKIGAKLPSKICQALPRRWRRRRLWTPMLEGNEIQQANAEQADTQSRLEGTPTWISLPEEE